MKGGNGGGDGGGGGGGRRGHGSWKTKAVGKGNWEGRRVCWLRSLLENITSFFGMSNLFFDLFFIFYFPVTFSPPVAFFPLSFSNAAFIFCFVFAIPCDGLLAALP